MFSEQTQAYFNRFELYLTSLGHCVQAGLFDSLSEDILTRLEKKADQYTHLITPDSCQANGIIDALCFPVSELKHYQRFLSSLGGILMSDSSGTKEPQSPSQLDRTQVMEVNELLQSVLGRIEVLQASFTKTRSFWLDQSNHRYRKLLCRSKRSLLLTSKDASVWLSNTVGISPMIFLFSDQLASWTQMSLTEWPLKLMWIKSYSETKVKLQLPEEEITLCFPGESEKQVWCSALLDGISRTTTKTNVSVEPPSERTGFYKFRLGRLKGCTYSGQWYNGQMHGKGSVLQIKSQKAISKIVVKLKKGVIDSPDGKRYAGQFSEHERSGFGVTVNQKPTNLKSYKGFYANDLPNGLGEAEYVDGSVYKGPG